MAPLPAAFLGKVVGTPGATALLEQHGLAPGPFLRRLLRHDWGTLEPDDVQANIDAIVNGDRLLANYRIGTGGDKLWIITYPYDHSTLLLPEEY